MEPNDNSYIRVILRPAQGLTVLDAHRVGDILFHLRRPTFCGQIRNSTDLPKQVALLYTLIERFGPTQVVGVPAFGDPLENVSFERAFFPETLYSCLSLPYILCFIIIHKVPEMRVLSLPGTLSHMSSAAGGSNVVIVTGGRYSNITGRVHPFTQYPKKGTHTADSCITGSLIVNGLFKTLTFTRGLSTGDSESLARGVGVWPGGRGEATGGGLSSLFFSGGGWVPAILSAPSFLTPPRETLSRSSRAWSWRVK